MSTPPDYYRILHLPPTATPAEIKQAFRRLARRYHPDLHPQDPEASAKFRQLCAAYEVLSDPAQRHHYDQRRSPSGVRPRSPQTPRSRWYEQGLAYLAAREYPAAITALTAAIAAQPNQLSAYVKRCEAREALQDYRGMLEDCRLILAQAPTQITALHYRGRARYALGYTAAAIQAYTIALQHQDNYAPAYYDRALAHLDLGDRPAAIRDAHRALTLFTRQQQRDRASQTAALLRRLQAPASGRGPRRRNLGAGQVCPALAQLWPTIVILMRQPRQGLGSAYRRLDSVTAQTVGILLAAIAVGGSWVGLRGLVAARLTGWELYLMAALTFLGLVGGLSLSRRRLRGQGQTGADIFIAGATLFPVGLALLCWPWAMMLAPLFGGLILGLGLAQAVVTLYAGCTQIYRLTPVSAAITTNLLLFLTGALLIVLLWVDQSWF